MSQNGLAGFNKRDSLFLYSTSWLEREISVSRADTGHRLCGGIILSAIVLVLHSTSSGVFAIPRVSGPEPQVAPHGLRLRDSAESTRADKARAAGGFLGVTCNRSGTCPVSSCTTCGRYCGPGWCAFSLCFKRVRISRIRICHRYHSKIALQCYWVNSLGDILPFPLAIKSINKN